MEVPSHSAETPSGIPLMEPHGILCIFPRILAGFFLETFPGLFYEIHLRVCPVIHPKVHPGTPLEILSRSPSKNPLRICLRIPREFLQ